MKDLAYRNFPQLAISEGDTTPNPGFPAIAHSTTLGLLTKWNGASWSLIDDAREFEVDWIICPNLAVWIFNDGAMTIDFSTPLTDTTDPPVVGQVVLLGSEVDVSKTGVYVLGSVASLSAVPITRHPDWPVGRVIRKGMVFRTPRSSYQYGSYGEIAVTTVNTVDNSIDVDETTGTGLYGRGTRPMVSFVSTGSLPGGITSGQWYYTNRTAYNAVQLYTDPDFLSLVDITSAGTGDLTVRIAPAIISGSFAEYHWLDGDKEIGTGGFLSWGNPQWMSNNSHHRLELGIQRGPGLIGYATGISAFAVAGGLADADGALAIGGTARGGQSLTIGNYNTFSFGNGSHAIGPGAVAPNACMRVSYTGLTRAEYSSSDYSWVCDGKWHLQASTSDATETDCVTEYQGTRGLVIRRGYYNVIGRITANNEDRTKFSIWSVTGTIARHDSNEPQANIDIIPELSSGGAEELALKVVVVESTGSPNYDLTFRVKGPASAYYHWSVDLYFEGRDSYDYSTYSLDDLTSAKRTRIGYLVLPASESITAGAPVNIWNDSGTTKVRNANASNGRQTDGFVAMTYGTGDNVVIFLSGNISILSGLTIGPVYLGTTAGTYTSSAPGTGNLVQRLGFATTTSNIAFTREPAIQT